MKPIATVQLPIGKFQVIVSDYTNNEELGMWVRKFARALSLADPDLEPFAAELLRDVENYRAADAKRKQEAKARMAAMRNTGSGDGTGATPGHSDNTTTKSATASNRSPPSRRGGGFPADKAVVTEWALDNGLDPDDAGECWEATTERGGRDADGNPVRDWKGFVFRWCGTRMENRER